MRARKRAPAEAGIACERSLLDQGPDRTEPPVLQMAYIEVSVRCHVLGPAEEQIARRLHDALALDYPLALVAAEFRCQPLKHGLAGFLDLQEQRRGVSAHVEPDGAEGADAADTHHLEGYVLERVSIDEITPVRCQAPYISSERALGVYM